MRNTLILLICTFQLQAVTSYGQTARLTLDTKEIHLEQLFKQIEKNSEFLFNYLDADIANIKARISVKNGTIQEILTQALKNTSLTYSINDRHITIFRMQQNSGKTIHGTVLDDNGVPIIGANVVEKGTTNGIITDLDGKFSLSVSENAILQITYIGYIGQEIAVKNQTTFHITLLEDHLGLEEVVVIGYGTQRKVNLTGAIAQVSGEVLESRPITNISQGLQGVVPNLNVNVNSGAPGQSTSFNIRGNNSLNGGSPLVLVNNVQMNADLINPEDIQSISVLKDAASAAIYGARAAYGVILITTKNGNKGQAPRISFSANGYWQSPQLKIETINSMEYLTMIDLIYQNSGGSGHYFDPTLYEYAEKYYNDPVNNLPVYYEPELDPYGYQYCGNTNWWDELYKKASFSQQYNVNIAGGSEKTTYYASVGYNNENGMAKVGDDMYRKVNANLNLTSDITDWLSVTAKSMYNFTDERHPDGGISEANSTAYSNLGEYRGFLTYDISPLMPVRHPDGNYAGQGSYTNPISIQELGGNLTQKKNDLWLTGAVTITPAAGLTLNADYTFNTYNSGVKRHVRRFMDYTAVPGTERPYPWTKTTSVSMRNYENYYTAFNAFAEYEKKLNEVHYLKGMIGYNQEYKHIADFYAARQDLIDNDKPAINMATGQMYMNGAETHWGVEGVFARINYSYANKYLLEINGRYDGSSKFAKGHRYALFPSVSAAWRISEEAFWSPLKEVWNDMKIRASYGQLGNQVVDNLGNFPYLPAYGIDSSMNYLLGGIRQAAVSPSGLVSAGFTWERVEQINFGFDALLLNRLNITFDYYNRATKDMLMAGQQLPAVLGTSIPQENAADMNTKGFELSIGWTERLHNGLSYWIKGTLADYQSEITRFTNPEGLLWQYYTGQKLGEIWGYSSKGLFQSDEEVENSPSQINIWGGDWRAGDVKYEDLNGNGEIDYGDFTRSNPGDRKIIGNDTPRYSFGLTFGLEYKQFDFQMFWQGVGKRDYAASGVHFWGFEDEYSVPLKPALDYWTEENRDAYFPTPNWDNWGNRQTSDRYLQDASYLRLKNVTLGYTIAPSKIKKLHISRIRVYLVSENPIMFTKMIKSFDPETMDNLTYPISKKYSIGFNITF
ncbi:MAG: TonB-dependent receptor [Tannerellaceae bacterium]|nr:TonB-dependent receptor [Tannerellaceae bacterium]